MNEYFEKRFSCLLNVTEMYFPDDVDLNQYPRFLYKYKDFSSPYGLDMLKNQYLWAAKPNESWDNDDSRIRLNMDDADKARLHKFLFEHYFEIQYCYMQPKGMQPYKDNATLQEYLSKQEKLNKEYERLLPFLTSPAFEGMCDAVLSLPDVQPLEAKMKLNLENTVEFWRKRALVCCLTARNDNRRMWETYANGYEGFVMEYDFRNIQNPNQMNYIGNTFPIIYCPKNNMPSSNYVDCIIDAYMYDLGYKHDIEKFNSDTGKFMLYKNDEYELEEEWRILVKENKLEFPVNAIYIGYKCLPENEQELVKICRELNISAYKQKFNMISGKMYFDPIT